MPMNRAKYPPEWERISARIRFERAAGRCECEGECGLHHARRCVEVHGEPARFAKGRIILTVAHLDHDASSAEESRLRAMCQRCHLRYDAAFHAINAAATRNRKRREAQRAAGQRELLNYEQAALAAGGA